MFVTCTCSLISFVPLPFSIVDLIESQQCPGQEGDIQERIGSLDEQWEKLINKTNEKTQKLKEANQERQFNEGIRGTTTTYNHY